MRNGATCGGALLAAGVLLASVSGCAGHREAVRTAMTPPKPPASYLYYIAPRPARVPPAAPTAPEVEPASAVAVDVPEGWPVEHPDRKVISTYGTRRSSGGGKSRLHKGIDIKAPYGTSVVATGAGVVSLSCMQNGYGHIVVVDHGNGRATAYAHLSARSVMVGDEVHKGDVLGKIGRTGRATTPHLHYEVRIDGKAVDPAPYLPQE